MLGLATSILVDTSRAALTLKSLWVWMHPPIRLRQIQFLFSDEGRPLGFATWAYVTSETAHRLRSGAAPTIEDWNDGDQLWMMDVVAPYGHVRELSAKVRCRLSFRDGSFYYSDARNGRLRRGRGTARARQSPSA